MNHLGLVEYIDPMMPQDFNQRTVSIGLAECRLTAPPRQATPATPPEEGNSGRGGRWGEYSGYSCFGSSTPGNRHRTCDLTPCIVLLSRCYDTVSIPNLDFGAQYRAYAFPCQRLVAALTDSPTHDSGFRRLATPFRAEDFHLQSLASLSRRTVNPIKVNSQEKWLKLRRAITLAPVCSGCPAPA